MSAVATRDREIAGPAWLTSSRIGWAGVALGFLAFFVAVPPITMRSPVPTIVLGVAGLAVGAWTVRAGERRLGWGGIAMAVTGIAGGYAATQSGVGNLERVVVWSALFAAMLRHATPLIFAALGGLFSERSGVVNIALEGMLLMGAFFAVLGADLTGSWFLGLVFGMLSGGALALIHAIFSVSLRADQIVSGTALNFLALGITSYLFINRYGTEGTPDQLPAVPDVKLPGIESIPFFGDIFGQLNLLIWIGAGAGGGDLGRRVPHAAGPAAALGRARTRWRRRPRACRWCARATRRSSPPACSPRPAARTCRSASCTRSRRT